MANFEEIRYKCVKERRGKHESSSEFVFSTLAKFDMAKYFYVQTQKNQFVYPDFFLVEATLKKSQVAAYKNLGKFYRVPFKSLSNCRLNWRKCQKYFTFANGYFLPF